MKLWLHPEPDAVMISSGHTLILSKPTNCEDIKAEFCLRTGFFARSYMDDMYSLLFGEIGQLVETRSFDQGFRGAWFRAKIQKIARRKGGIWHLLEYYDFTEDKPVWEKLYQMPKHLKTKSKSVKGQLMLRPHFPPIYCERQKPDLSTITEVIIVVRDVWKVGDLVDWLTDGCFWSGRITQVLSDDMVKLNLPPPPEGEGHSYEAPGKELRPSLDWSPADGWTVPVLEENGNYTPCCHLVHPVTQGACQDFAAYSVDAEAKEVRAMSGIPLEVYGSPLSHTLTCLAPSADSSECSRELQMLKQPLGNSDAEAKTTNQQNSEAEAVRLETKKNLDRVVGPTGNQGCSNGASGSGVGGDSATRALDIEEEEVCDNGSKKMRIGEGSVFNSLCSDSLEAAILDLEELSNRVKSLKSMLELGAISSNTARPAWEFHEH
ncbi:Agenet-like domain [Dillenia turbinata]|uniref:Agenet-like domain n=1 Tax=Dillenia turbinata TaxID=194707 RepID=A0AAN8ZCF4_9MAGN